MAAAASRTDPRNQKAMPFRPKSISCADVISQLEDFVVAKLDDLVALGAVQMIVRGVAIVVLIGAAVRQAKLPKEARLDKQSKRSINRGPAHLMTGSIEIARELVGIEMLVRIEDVANHHPACLGQLVASNFEKFPKFVDRTVRDRRGDEQIMIRLSHGENPWIEQQEARPLNRC